MTEFALHLLRHGEVETPGRMMGRTDGAPTAAGITHCVAQARDLGVAALITSDLARARLAGAAIGGALTLKPAIDPRWRELDFGAWDGLTPAHIDSAALGQFWDDPDANPPPGGERWSDLRARVAAAIHTLAPMPTLVVSHGGAIRAALAVLCGFDHRQIWAFDLPCGALVSLRVWPGDPITAQIAGLYP
jgi:alpha-ribazole phosphatase